jgi:HPt (histidine-containing phosphotransfer) domain-containing protein
MDVNMPVMDGFTATQKLRQQGLKTSIIALTANAMKGFEQECLDAGYSGYCPKPIDIDRFMAQMADLLGGRKVINDTGDAPAPAAGGPTDSHAKEFQSATGPPIYSTMPGSEGKLRHLVVRFVDYVKDQLQAAEQAREQGKLEELAVFAHKLKGSGGSFGFNEFTAPAARLEKLAKAGGSEVDLRQIMAELRGLAARLVIPGAEPADTSTTGGGPPCEPSSDSALLAAQPRPVKEKSVMSRLGSSPRFHKVILQFIEKLKEELIRAQAAWENKDLKELALIAHWLKGAGGTVGFDDFTDPATRLEKYAKTAQVAPAGQMLERLKHLSEAIVPPAMVDGGETGKRAAAGRRVA